MAALSVIIPAHNEEAVIGRCLRAVCQTSRRDRLEIIVVANGCTDDTVRIATSFDGVRVIDLPEASKHAALVAGDAAAHHFPRAFLDADIEVTGDALLATADAMTAAGALGAAPRLSFDFTGCPWFVRSFHRVYERLGWSTDAPIGTGLYVLSAEGRARVGPLPAIINDDQYVHDMLTRDERLCVDSEVFVVRPPRTFRGLVLRRTRTLEGQVELAREFGSLPGRTYGPGPGPILREDLRRLADVAVFGAVKVAARAAIWRKQRRGMTGWERDDSSRELAVGS